MENKEIHQKVENTLKVLDSIEKVEVNHFFKHKVLQKISAEKEKNASIISWFTPQLQLATFCVILIVNIGSIFYAFSSSGVTKNSDLETFAQEYSLQSSSSLILN